MCGDKNMGNVSVGWIIGLLLTFILLPIAIASHASINTTAAGWDTQTVALWGILALVAIAAVAQKMIGSK